MKISPFLMYTASHKQIAEARHMESASIPRSRICSKSEMKNMYERKYKTDCQNFSFDVTKQILYKQ